MDIVGEPLVPAPAHGLPIEYMEGPYRYHGTLAGEPVTAFAFNERSLALYRDWELLQVLESEADDPQLRAAVDEISELVAAGRRDEAVALAMKVRGAQQDTLTTILDDLITALSTG